MKVRYIGLSKGILSLTDGKVYECLGVEYGFLRVIDDEGYSHWEKEPDEKGGYLYPPAGVLVNEDGSRTGRFEIVEDDAQGTLHQLFQNNSESINTAGKKGDLCCKIGRACLFSVPADEKYRRKPLKKHHSGAFCLSFTSICRTFN